MDTKLKKLNFSGSLLRRGFWLYAWEITAESGEKVYYVGRTGDSSSLNAQSPFNRLGQHLGHNRLQNMLRTHLMKANFQPESCSYELVAYGPIYPEGSGEREHRERRDVVAAMEKALCHELKRAGCRVLNEVKCRKPLVESEWAPVRSAFADHFHFR